MQAIVDRIEENIVVIEYEGKMYNADISLVCGEVNEGDVVDIKKDNQKITYIKKDDKKTLSRKEYINNLTKDMWQ